MSKVAIVTDSTTYLPDKLNQELNIHVIPLKIIWDEEIIADGVDIMPNEFYQRLATAKTMPTTSQPSPAEFEDLYKKLLDDDFEILSIHISNKLSGTISSATQAKALFPDKQIEIADGMSASMGTGWAVVEAARAAKNGASLQDCKQIAEKAAKNTETVFKVETLEFLHKGGRIGGASRFIGTALNFKPILRIVDGAIAAEERVRTTKKATSRLLELLENEAKNCKTVKIGILHANAEEAARKFVDSIDGKFESKEIFITMVSPVIGTHLGPGTLGFGVLKEN